VAAGVQLERLWREHPGPATAGFVAGRAARIPAGRRAATVAVLRSFTVEPVIPVLRAAAAVHGIDLEVHLGDFGTYGQDLLDPGRPLHHDWNPDVVIVATQTQDVAPELWDRFAELAPEEVDKLCDQVIDQFTALIAGFRRLSGAPLVLHGFEEPSAAAFGIADRTAARSQRTAIQSMNARLTELANAHADVHVLDYDALIARVGRAGWRDERKWQAMRMPIRSEHLVDLADEWLRYIQPSVGRTAKALVVDLDGTLWGGVLGEDGIDGIQIGPDAPGAGYRALQRSLLDIRARGVLLAICSKNNHADAMEALENHPEMLVRPDSFAVIRANWESKVDNLRSIAGELNIGLDSIAFLDDSPFECDLVRRTLPEVTVIELDRPPTEASNPVAGNPLFERTRVLAEDRDRASYYTQQARRRDALDGSDSLESYLHSLDTVVTVSIADDSDVARVAELTQKTNQFNLTTRRYSEAEIEEFLHREESTVLVARAADRFGDHGLIGVVIVRTAETEWMVDTMLLSCRVIGRGVETAIVSVVVDRAAEAGARRVRGQFIPTAKNEPARDFYAKTGFDRLDDDDPGAADPPGMTWWSWTVGRALDAPPWINLRRDRA
jgi:FkbH-like protein